MRKLLTIPNDILRSMCKPVDDINSEVEEIALELVDYLASHQNDDIVPISMAAPQLGESIRVIVFYPNPYFKHRRAIEVLINPELVKAKKFLFLYETCLSIPRKKYLVRRAGTVKVKGITLDGRPKSWKASGLFAQMLQHEMDHLDGVLIDSAGDLVKEV